MKCDSGDMQDNCESTQLSGEDELEVSKKSSLTRPFLDQRSFFGRFRRLPKEVEGSAESRCRGGKGKVEKRHTSTLGKSMLLSSKIVLSPLGCLSVVKFYS